MPTRRNKGEGSVSTKKTADGRYVARLDLGFVNGKRKRKAVYGKTKAEVLKKLADARKAVDAGLPLAPERQTAGAFFASWIETVKPELKPQTYRRNESIVRLHLAPLAGIRLAKLTPQQIQQLYAAKQAEGQSRASVKRIHIVLHKALEDAMRWGLVGRNVADLVRPPRSERHEIRPLSEEQAAAFLEAAKSDRFHALYVLALTTGMRQGELLGLRWEDMDLDGATVQVSRNLQRAGGTWVIGSPKSGRNRRADLTREGVNAIREHRKSIAESRLRAGELWEGKWDLVFCTAVGTPIEHGNLRKRSFQLILQRAGLPPIRFHDLRHTAATLMLGRGVPLKVVSEVLGHASISITADLYSHVSPSMQRQAADAMEAVFRRS